MAPGLTARKVGRPTDLSAAYNTILDWFAANGVNGWMPQQVRVVVDVPVGQITYTAFQWDEERGWNGAHVAVVEDRDADGRPIDRVPKEERTVPLLQEPGPEVLAAAVEANAEGHARGDRIDFTIRR